MQDLVKKNETNFFVYSPDLKKSQQIDTLLFTGLLFSVLFVPFIKISNEFFFSIEEFFVGLITLRIIFLRFFWVDKFVLLLALFSIYITFTILINSNRTVLREYFELYKYFKFGVLYVFAIYYFIKYTNWSFFDKLINFSFILLILFNFLHYFDVYDFNKNITILYDSDQRDILVFGFNSIGLPAAKRIIGTMGNPNDNAILFLFFLAYYQSKLKNWSTIQDKTTIILQRINYLFFYLSLLMILMCQSRTGIIAAIVIYITGLILKKITMKQIGIDLLVVLLLIGIMYGLDHISLQYLSNTKLNIDQNTSITGRFEIWKKLLSEWMQQPVFGYGPNKNYMYQNNIYPENEYIFHLWRYGVIGLVLYCGLLWFLFIRYFRDKQTNYFFSLVVVFVSVCALTNNPLTNPKFLIIFALISGYSMSLYYQRNVINNEFTSKN